jgi:hypothetical protein
MSEWRKWSGFKVKRIRWKRFYFNNKLIFWKHGTSALGARFLKWPQVLLNCQAHLISHKLLQMVEDTLNALNALTGQVGLKGFKA